MTNSTGLKEGVYDSKRFLVRDTLLKIEARIWELVSNPPKEGDLGLHWRICCIISDEFDLWYDNSFPLWLSYVVSGRMRDSGYDA